MRQLENNLNGIDTSLRSVTGAIEWRHIKVQPNTTPGLPSRAVRATITPRATRTRLRSLPAGNMKNSCFTEAWDASRSRSRRGVSADGKVLVENRGHEAVPNVTFFENRGGRLGYRSAGTIQDTVTLDPPAIDDSFPQLRYDLENALVEQGLFLKEAQAMVETWRDSWFEEGARLLYIVPSRSVDAILPLRVEPAPSKTARVFVGRIELVTPDITRTMEDALARSDWPTIARYGRFPGPDSEAP